MPRKPHPVGKHSMLAFMINRQKSILGSLPTHSVVAQREGPRLTPQQWAQACQAAREKADKNPSDPHLYDRALSLVKQGIYLPSELNDNVSI